MNKKKIIAVIVAAVVVIAGGLTAFFLLRQDKSLGVGTDCVDPDASVQADWGQNIRVGTYNINGLTSVDDLRQLADDINQYELDVVCLQEVNYTQDDFVLQKLAALAGFDYYRYFAESGKSGNGIGFISKLAFENCGSEKLTSAKDTPQKIAAFVTVRSNGIPVDVYTTQLNKESATLRLSQMKDIVKIISSREQANNFVIAGDFAVASFDELSALSLDAKFANNADRIFRTVQVNEENTFTSPDNIIVSSTDEFNKIERYNNTKSDHLLYMADIELNQAH